MSLICVVYDLKGPGQKWAKIDEALQKAGFDWYKICNTTYLLGTDSSAIAGVYAKVKPHLDGNDVLAIFPITGPLQPHGLTDDQKSWIRDRL